MSTFEILDAFSLLRREFGLLWATEMKSFDLGPKQTQILYLLTFASATMGELAEHTVSDKASATRAVSSLEGAGLVRRVEREGDRRVIVIELTAKGRQKAAKAIDVRKLIGSRVHGALSTSEQKTLSALMNKAAGSLRERRQTSQTK